MVKYTMLTPLHHNPFTALTKALGLWGLLLASSLLPYKSWGYLSGSSIEQPSFRQVEFKGVVLSRYNKEPVPGVIVEITKPDGEKVEPGSTNDEGAFMASLEEGKEYTMRFFKALSVGNALISTKKVLVETANGQLTQTFVLPISATVVSRRGFDVRGKVLGEDGKPFDGTLIFRSSSESNPIAEAAVVNGDFRVSVTAKSNDKLSIDVESNTGETMHQNIYELSAANWGKQEHTITLANDEVVSEEKEVGTIAEKKPEPLSSPLDSKRLLIRFQGATDQIAPPSKAQLNTVIGQVQSEGVKVSVRGYAHSHNLPLYDLVQRRVLAVVAFLELQGLNAESIHYSYAMPTSEDSGFDGYLIRVK